MRLLRSTWLFVAALSVGVNATQGTIGYGISLYKPYCCTACHDVLSELYLSCTTFETPDGVAEFAPYGKPAWFDAGATAHTSKECYASSQAFLQSFAYCTKTHCDQENVSTLDQTTCFRNKAADGLDVSSLQQSLPPTPPITKLRAADRWVTETILVDEEAWAVTRRSLEAYEASEVDHNTYSILIILLGAGVPLVAGVFGLFGTYIPAKSWHSRFVRTLRSHVTTPALLNQRHSQSLPKRLGYVPRRPLSILISTYIILNIIFCAISFHSVQPNSLYGSRSQEIAAYIGNRTGVLSFANLALSVLFSTRNNPLLHLSGWSMTSFLTLHRWTARIAIVQALAHAFTYTVSYNIYYHNGEYDTTIKTSYFWTGVVATAALCLLGTLSALPLRRYSYESFLVLHIILALVALTMCFFHIDLRFGDKRGYQTWIYIAIAFWVYDRVVRIAKVLYYNILSESTAEVSIVPNTKFALLTLRIRRQWNVKPGMHTFVYFPSLGRFWENHPFTIADWGFETIRVSTTNPSPAVPDGPAPGLSDKETSTYQAPLHPQVASDNNAPTTRQQFYVRCLFRIHDGTTLRLYDKIASSPSSSQSHVMTEGPYGGYSMSYHALQTADKVLIIAGGIGITYAAGFAKRFAEERMMSKDHAPRKDEEGNKNALGSALSRRRGVDHPVVGTKPDKRMMPRCKKFMLAWSVRERSLLELARRDLLPNVGNYGPDRLDDGSMHYNIWFTGKQIGEGGHLSRMISRGGQTSRVVSRTEENENVTVEQGKRMDAGEVIGEYSESGLRTVVLVCGPGALSDEVRRQVVTWTRRGRGVELIEESFAW